jgi:hypothetical protein
VPIPRKFPPRVPSKAKIISPIKITQAQPLKSDLTDIFEIKTSLLRNTGTEFKKQFTPSETGHIIKQFSEINQLINP